MAHNVQKAYQIAEKPWVVVSDDATLHAFLVGLNGAGASDLTTNEETTALWAVHVPSGGDSGSAFVVSAATYRRVQAGRYNATGLY